MVNINSSLIKSIDYDAFKHELKVYFNNQKWKIDCTHCFVPEQIYQDLRCSDSPGRYYLDYIEPIFKTYSQIKNLKMAKKADKILNLRLDVTKINKDWLFKGEKGIYLDITAFYSEEQDQYKGNGFIVQAVPKKIFETDRNVRGNILGNIKDWGSQPRVEIPAEALPNSEGGTIIADTTGDFTDDLPF